MRNEKRNEKEKKLKRTKQSNEYKCLAGMTFHDPWRMDNMVSHSKQ